MHMNDYFDIYGPPIKYASIKEFRIVQREYIYRPVYVESIITEQKFMKKSTYSKYVFEKMMPYAAILDESDRRGVFSGIKANSFGESVGKELLGDIRETVGDKLNIKAIKAKKYKCTNQSGRIFSVYLDEVPALVMSADGKFTDVMKDDPLYQLIGDSTMPAINIIHALVIHADQNYTFYGNGIQIDDIQQEYHRLQRELDQYNQEKKGPKRLLGKAKIEGIEDNSPKEIPVFPKISIPTFKRSAKNESTKEYEIAEIKKLFENGSISEEECKERIQEVIDSI